MNDAPNPGGSTALVTSPNQCAELQLFSVLQLLDPAVDPAQCKIHLAGWNGHEDPLDQFLGGTFEAWQSRQTQRNFERAQILALIQLPQRHRWLFAGVHESHGCSRPPNSQYHVYETSLGQKTAGLVGRLVVAFERPGRQSYLLAENWVDAMNVAEIRPERLSLEAFPGYSRVALTKSQLDLVIGQRPDSWYAALSQLAGIYVITDRTSGKLYIGSASGQEGLWARWSCYSQTGHGNNQELRELLQERGADHAANFQFGILEVAGTHGDDLPAREAHWKRLLLTRTHGLNGN
jgi:hypothetical protein